MRWKWNRPRATNHARPASSWSAPTAPNGDAKGGGEEADSNALLRWMEEQEGAPDAQPQPSYGSQQEAAGWGWEVVLQFDPRGSTHAANLRQRALDQLKGHGVLITHLRNDGDPNASTECVVLSAPSSVLERVAEQAGFEMEVVQGSAAFSKRTEGRHVPKFEPFTLANADKFGDRFAGLFNSRQRQQLLRTLLERADGGGVDVDEALADGTFCQVFPLHNSRERDVLYQVWLSRWAPMGLLSPPCTDIKNYFGEKLGMYFAFLSHYTRALLVLSLFGVVTTAALVLEGGQSVSGDAPDSPVLPLYCILLSLWSTLFVESWKRHESELAFLWNMRDFEVEEKTRHEFVGQLRTGVYTRTGLFVEAPSSVYSKIRGQQSNTQKYFPQRRRLLRQLVGVPIVLSFIAVTLIGTVALLAFKAIQTTNSGTALGAIAAGVCNAVFIKVMNVVYTRVAQKLNSFENHRTDTQHEDALIAKIFLFQFVNSYVSLFYIAFLKPHEYVLGVYVGKCQNGSCMDELFFQLATLLIATQIASNVVEVLLPFVVQRVKSRDFSLEDEADTPQSVVHEQATAMAFAGTFHEYSEMVVQFGYVTLFAAAFPLAPLSCLANNVIEIRTDAIKFLYGSQRGWHHQTKSIGTWIRVLEVLSIFSVVTNCGLVGFTSDFLSGRVQCDDGNCQCVGLCLSAINRFWITVAIEHAVIFAKVMMKWLIPDVPRWVERELARQSLEEHALGA